MNPRAVTNRHFPTVPPESPLNSLSASSLTFCMSEILLGFIFIVPPHKPGVSLPINVLGFYQWAGNMHDFFCLILRKGMFRFENSLKRTISPNSPRIQTGKCKASSALPCWNECKDWYLPLFLIFKFMLTLFGFQQPRILYLQQVRSHEVLALFGNYSVANIYATIWFRKFFSCF